MNWRENLSIGIADIDLQHQKLIQIADRFEHAAGEEQAHSELGRTLKELVEYTRYHFSSEEDVMAAAGYPELGPHHILHEQLTAQIRDILLQLKAGKIPRPIIIVRFLGEWVTTHIQNEDVKIGRHLRKRWSEHAEGNPRLAELSIGLSVIRNQLLQGRITPEQMTAESSAKIAAFCGAIGRQSAQNIRELHSALSTFAHDGLISPDVARSSIAGILAANPLPGLLADLPEEAERERFKAWLAEEWNQGGDSLHSP